MFWVVTQTEVNGINNNKEVTFEHLWSALITTTTSIDETRHWQKDNKQYGFQAKKTNECTNKHKEHNKSKTSKPKARTHYLPPDKWRQMTQKEKDDFLAQRQ